MANGKPIIQSITPKFATIGLRVTVLGHNLDDLITIEFLSGPETGVSIEVENSNSKQLIFQTPQILFGRYELRISNTNGTAIKDIEFHVAENIMQGIKVCPPVYDADDYAKQQAEYLPKGPAWTRSIYTFMFKCFASVGLGMQRFHEQICTLIKETTPQLTTELIPEWEKELGLPEPCITNPPTDLDARRAEIVRKYNALGGSNKQYFIDLAASLGIKVTIEDSVGNPFLMGTGKMGDQLQGGPWLFTWFVDVDITEEQIKSFKVGTNTMNTPLRWWGNNELECFFNILKPSHTIVSFRYNTVSENAILLEDENELRLENDEPILLESA